MANTDPHACLSERDIIYTQRALIAAHTRRDVKAPVVAQTADLVLRLTKTFIRLDPEWTGTLTIEIRPGRAPRVQKLVPVSDEEEP